MYSKFVGISQEVASLIEARRLNARETENDILLRVLSEQTGAADDDASYYAIGQGARLKVGELMYLFLTEQSKKEHKPHGIAVVKEDGIYVDGRRVEPSRGSAIHPAMQYFQAKNNHRNDKGELVSMSAWRQWYVIRNSKLVQLGELKEPSLARRRGRRVMAPANMTLEELFS